ncbi:uncharacterized protein LOC110897699 [Helianthus annuus]|uniref:DUF7953 domain-containing protein n=1 Tax=Helianthus annuus TaxID=4232 RepID=A0A251SSN1_HELAN|nr:uncharacterized protein LOC110897699 [Helianthus annuus]
MASRWNSRVSIILLFCFPEVLLSAVVTLHSLEIYTTHELLASTPTVYFRCSGENKTYLPDVTKKNTLYTFRGEESFQPLMKFESTKCKRCGFYEEDRITSDDVFDEWEFCPSDFKSDDGRYIRTKDKEFNATFLCPECVKKGTLESSDTALHEKGNGMHWSVKLIIAISVVASTVLLIIGLIVAYKYWLKRKRQHEQARFLKLFEDTDEIEDELGIGPLSDSI